MPNRSLPRPDALRVLAVALLAGTVGTAWADGGGPQGSGDRGISGRDSRRQMDDIRIATKVKTDLLATRGVSGLELNVEAVHGVVSLTGELGSQAELDRAVRVARGVDGVARVDSSGVRINADAGG